MRNRDISAAVAGLSFWACIAIAIIATLLDAI